MENWRNAWRNGFVRVLSTPGLMALQKALLDDDPRLVQGKTVGPKPLSLINGLPVEGCCAVSFCGWKGHGLDTVGEIIEYFSYTYRQAEDILGNQGSYRWFIDWFDSTPRDEMRRELLAEVEKNLENREAKVDHL